MALVSIDLAYRELFTVPRDLGSPRLTDDKPSTGTVSVGNFCPKVPHRQLKKPTLLDVPGDENM